jgi:hypothetical protein
LRAVPAAQQCQQLSSASSSAVPAAQQCQQLSSASSSAVPAAQLDFSPHPIETTASSSPFSSPFSSAAARRGYIVRGLSARVVQQCKLNAAAYRLTTVRSSDSITDTTARAYSLMRICTPGYPRSPPARRRFKRSPDPQKKFSARRNVLLGPGWWVGVVPIRSRRLLLPDKPCVRLHLHIQ